MLFQTNQSKLYLDAANNSVSKKINNSHSNSLWNIWSIGELTYKKNNLIEFLNDLSNSTLQPHELNGHFLIIGYNRKQQTWNFWTSRFGTIHIYYSTHSKYSHISTYYPTLPSQYDTELDLVAMMGYFKTGIFPADLTWYKTNKIIRPATHATFDRTGKLIQQKRYWNWSFEPNYTRSYTQTLDEFTELYTKVINELSQHDKVAIPLSGGLDSRSTIAALSPQNKNWSNLHTFSYGYSNDSIETRISEKLAKACQLPFKKYTIQPYLFNSLPEVLKNVEGFQDITQSRQAMITTDLAKNSEFIIAAHLGDLLLDHMGLPDSPLTKIEIYNNLTTKFNKPGSLWLTENFIPFKKNPEVKQEYHALMQQELDSYLYLKDNNFITKVFKIDQWSFRWTLASLRMYQASVFPRLPFYDTRITDFLCTVPNHYLKNRKLQIDFIKKKSPKLGRIIWEKYNSNLYHYTYHNSLLLPKRALYKAWRIITRNQPILRNWEVQFLNPAGKDSLIKVILNNQHITKGLFTKEQLTQIIDDFYKNPFLEKKGYTISALLTFISSLALFSPSLKKELK